MPANLSIPAAPPARHAPPTADWRIPVLVEVIIEVPRVDAATAADAQVYALDLATASALQWHVSLGGVPLAICGITAAP